MGVGPGIVEQYSTFPWHCRCGTDLECGPGGLEGGRWGAVEIVHRPTILSFQVFCVIVLSTRNAPVV